MAGTDASCCQGHRPDREQAQEAGCGWPCEAQSKISEGLGAPPSTPVPQETATAVDQVAAQAGPAPSVEEDLVERLRRLRYPDPPEPCPHPRYADPSWNGFEKVGYRGANSGAYGDEKWDPDVPPCVISDERPPPVFGS